MAKKKCWNEKEKGLEEKEGSGPIWVTTCTKSHEQDREVRKQGPVATKSFQLLKATTLNVRKEKLSGGGKTPRMEREGPRNRGEGAFVKKVVSGIAFATSGKNRRNTGGPTNPTAYAESTLRDRKHFVLVPL